MIYLFVFVLAASFLGIMFFNDNKKPKKKKKGPHRRKGIAF